MSFLQENKDNIILIKETYTMQRSKKIKRVIIIAGVVLLIIGGVIGYAIYDNERNERITKEVNSNVNQQNTYTEQSVSHAEAFIEHLELKLSTKDQFYPVLSGEISLYNEVTYTEDVKSIELFGLNIKYLNEEVKLYGYGKAFFEYGTNLRKLKAVKVSDNEVDVFIQKPFFRDETAHRIAGSYSPDPEKPNTSSGDAKRKTEFEVNYPKLMGTSNNIQQRAMITWEDKFDKNIKPSIEKEHTKDKTLSNLDKTGEDEIRALIESLNINPNKIKVNVKVDNTL